MLHRYMHLNSFLYRHLHSVHHRLYVPYAFGALYNSLLEGFLLDTLGTGIAHISTGLSARESMILYTFSTLKTVDDHCGYELPFDPFQKLFPNNAAYHDIHHQHFGIKTNYAQPFFTFWDTWYGTRYPDTENMRPSKEESGIPNTNSICRIKKLLKLKRYSDVIWYRVFWSSLTRKSHLTSYFM